jgi:uncharacterized DUF497 family protein
LYIQFNSLKPLGRTEAPCKSHEAQDELRRPHEKFFDQAFVLRASRNRHRAIGVNIRGVICVVFAYYGKEAFSVISMRPASSNERKGYEENRR